MGYGKRITFEADNLNANENYFYSDTHLAGYAFSLHGLCGREKFLVYDVEQYVVAQADVERVQAEKELSTETDSTGGVIKTVSVALTCSLRFKRAANLLPILCNRTVQLQGVLVLFKAKRAKCAEVSCIRDVNVDPVGLCTLELA